MILLDTHVLVWLNEDSNRLGPLARSLLLMSSQQSIFVSSITFWEIALLVQKGRLKLDRELDVWLEQAISFAVAGEMPVTRDIGLESVRLPETFHADPADRFIVSTARLWGMDLLTADQSILKYAGMGHLAAIDATL
jgi:PIN domain nuclease of toxin-antitoxin system